MTKSTCPFIAVLAFCAIVALGVAALVAAPSIAQAQSMAGDYNPAYPSEHVGVIGGYGGYHSSTAAEGYARGLAAVIDAHGNYNLKTAHARILNEEARSRYYDNVVKKADTYWERKNVYNEEMALRRLARAERRAAGRAKLEERRANEYRLAYQLTPDQYDVATGRIFWPEVLSNDDFRVQRTELDALFAQRIKYGASAPAGTTAHMVRLVKQLQRDLSEQRGELSRDEYRQATRFLTCLKYEAEYPTPLS